MIKLEFAHMISYCHLTVAHDLTRRLYKIQASKSDFSRSNVTVALNSPCIIYLVSFTKYKLHNLGDLDFDLSRSLKACKVKFDGTVYGFILVFDINL